MRRLEKSVLQTRETDKSAGQTLKDFDEMMKELKPYLPPKVIIKKVQTPYYIPTESIPYPIPKRNPFPGLL